jgi:hypothetical protein
MARKAQKKTKKAPAKRPARKAKPAAKKPAARAKSKTKSRVKKSEAESQVEQHWQQYWDCRKRLEEAVSLVRDAREALQKSQEAERSRRIEFDKVKGSLTTLLDVEPATSQPHAVQQLQADAQELARSSSDPKRTA